MSRQIDKDSIIRIDTRSKWLNICLILICFFFLLGVRLQVNQGTTGDEPYYLLMDYSLVHDHDLALNNNLQQGDYLSFYNNPSLGHQGLTTTIKHRYAVKEYSSHGFGLPVFLLPGFFIGAKAGAVFEMTLLATFVVWLTWVWTKQVTKNRKLAYIASGLLALCYFFNGLVGAIYPDMFIAATTLISLITLECYYKQPKARFLLGLLLGFLILVHFKTLTLVFPILLVLAYKLWKSERKLPLATMLIVMAFLAYFELTLYQWFGSWNLSAIQGGQSFGDNPLHNISAMLFDSNRSLLIYNPILLLIFVGLPLWFKKHRESFLVTGTVLIPSIAVLCIIPNWSGSAAPTGRYIIDFLPAFIPALAFAIDRMRVIWQRAVIVLLAILTLLITLDATLMRFPIIDGSVLVTRAPLLAQIERHTGLVLDNSLLTYSNHKEGHLVSSRNRTKLMIGYMAVIGLTGYGYYLSASGSEKRLRAKNP